MKKTILTIVILAASFAINAQTNLTFTSFNEPYQDLENSTSLNNGMLWDDPGYTIPLGFNFQLGDQTFDVIYVVEDGGGANLSSVEITDAENHNLIFPVLQDVVDLGEANGGTSLSNISFLIEGNAGSRIAKIEYNNVGFYDDETGNDFLNFQVWLYENTNVIEYRFGESSIQNPTESYEDSPGIALGIAGLLDVNSDVLLDNAYLLSGNPSNPDLIVFASGEEVDVVTPSLTGDIPNGMVYRFSPEVLSVADFSEVQIRIYPNPATSIINIDGIFEDTSVAIFNSLGQKMSFAIDKNRGIDVSTFSNGLYYLKATTEDGIATKSFVKI